MLKTTGYTFCAIGLLSALTSTSLIAAPLDPAPIKPALIELTPIDHALLVRT